MTKEKSLEAMNQPIIIIEEEEEAVVNSFDLLPDDVVLTIFEKLRDAKSLCSSMCACRRFRRIVPGVREISYGVAQKKPPRRRGPKNPTATAGKSNNIKNLLMKPFVLLSHMMAAAAFKLRPKKEENDGGDDLDFYSFHVPNRVLKPFDDVRSISLRLPCQKQGKGSSSSSLLKWRADFGREIRSCVILGAKSWGPAGEIENPRKESPTEQQIMTEDELKLRIVWTISCLIAASARHYLVRETLRGIKSIENVIVSDEIEQGIMRMDREGILEMREKLTQEEKLTSSSSSGNEGEDGVVDESAAAMVERRSKVPALKMKMWYLDRIEVSGKELRGATLVVIRPAADVEGDSKEMKCEELAIEAFGGGDLVLDCAVRKLMVAKRCYSLEMNSF